MDDNGFWVSQSLIGPCIYRRTGNKQMVVDVLGAVLTPDQLITYRLWHIEG